MGKFRLLLAVLLSSLGPVGAQEKPSADLVVLRAQVLQCNAAMDRTDAVAVRGGRIVAVGEAAVMPWIQRPRTKVIDAAGAEPWPEAGKAEVAERLAARIAAHLAAETAKC